MSDDNRSVYKLIENILTLAEKSIDDALRQVTALKSTSAGLLAIALRALSARLYLKKHDYFTAFQEIKFINSNNVLMEDDMVRALYYEALGDIYSAYYLFNSANDYYLDAVYDVGRFTRNNIKALFYYKTALSYIAMNDYMMAEAYFIRSLENYDKNALCPLTEKLEGKIYGGLIRASIRANHFEDVEKNLLKLTLLMESDEPYVKTEYLFSQLDYLIYHEKYEALDELFQEGVDWFKGNNDKVMLLRFSNRYYTCCKRRQARCEEIIAGIEACLSYVGDYHYSHSYQRLLKTLISCHQTVGNLERAVAMYHKYVVHVKRTENYTNGLAREALIVYKAEFFDNREQLIIDEKDRRIVEQNDMLKREMLRLKLISDIGKQIVDSSNYGLISDIMLKYLSRDFSIDAASLVMSSEEDEQLVYLNYAEGGQNRILPPIHIGDEENLLAECVSSRQIIYIDDIANRTDDSERAAFFAGNRQVGSVLACPILYEEQVIGAYSFQSEKCRAYDMIDVKLVKEIATFLAISIINTQKAYALQRAEKETLRLNGDLESVQNQFDLTKCQDGLTKIYNRYYLEEQYEKFVDLASEKNKVVAAYLVDIDNFDGYNNRYGILEGDNVLVVIANILDNSYEGEERILVRYRSDEFICLEMVNDVAEVARNSRLICDSVQKIALPFEGSKSGVLTVCVGANVVLSETPCALNDLIDATYKALYKAKNMGNSSVCTAKNGDVI